MRLLRITVRNLEVSRKFYNQDQSCQREADKFSQRIRFSISDLFSDFRQVFYVKAARNADTATE
jgi:hypothetical protein